MTEATQGDDPGSGALVLRLFDHVLGRAAPRGLDTSPTDVPEWDSLAHIHLVHAIEQWAGRRFPERQLVITRETTLRSLAEAL